MPPEPVSYKYFTSEEVVGLDEQFVRRLDAARSKTIELDTAKRGCSFEITSGLRTADKNSSIIGAVPDSAHLQGVAVDLRVENSHEVYLIVSAAISVGINRIGIYVNAANVPTHIHLDVATDRVSEVVWIKREGQA